MTTKTRSPITTHVLDINRGKPAPGIPISLEFKKSETEWSHLAKGTTNSDGRIETLLPADLQIQPGIYRMTFNTREYFKSTQTKSFYPHVVVTFEVSETTEHFHIPLLMSAFGYSTYRGT